MCTKIAQEPTIETAPMGGFAQIDDQPTTTTYRRSNSAGRLMLKGRMNGAKTTTTVIPNAMADQEEEEERGVLKMSVGSLPNMMLMREPRDAMNQEEEEGEGEGEGEEADVDDDGGEDELGVSYEMLSLSDSFEGSCKIHAGPATVITPLPPVATVPLIATTRTEQKRPLNMSITMADFNDEASEQQPKMSNGSHLIAAASLPVAAFQSSPPLFSWQSQAVADQLNAEGNKQKEKEKEKEIKEEREGEGEEGPEGPDDKLLQRIDRLKYEIQELMRMQRDVEANISREPSSFQKDNSRKRMLKRSADPLSEMEKRRVLILAEIANKKKERLEIERALSKNKTKRPSLTSPATTSSLTSSPRPPIYQAAFPIPIRSRLAPEMERTSPPASNIDWNAFNRSQSRQTKKPKKQEIDNMMEGSGYSGASELVKDMGGTSCLEANCKQEIGELEVDYSSLRFLRKLGSGAYGEVWLTDWDGRTVAVKRLLLNQKETRALALKTFRRELICMKRARESQHIVPILGACITDDFCCIIMQYMESGSLHDLLYMGRTLFGLEQNLRILKDIAKGMSILHTINPPIIHRDLTTQNILIHEERSFIGDFGIALFKEKRSTLTSSGRVKPIPMSPVGHPRYRAPEVTRNQLFSKRADVYPFGTVIYELFVRAKPFPHFDDKQVSAHLADGGAIPELPPGTEMPQVIYDLMVRCWASDPKQRPNFTEVRRDLKDLVRQLRRARQQQQQAVSTAAVNNHKPDDPGQDREGEGEGGRSEGNLLAMSSSW